MARAREVLPKETEWDLRGAGGPGDGDRRGQAPTQRQSDSSPQIPDRGQGW